MHADHHDANRSRPTARAWLGLPGGRAKLKGNNRMQAIAKVHALRLTRQRPLYARLSGLLFLLPVITNAIFELFPALN